MKTCLVSLISDQTIPNILIILSFKPDHLLFITTQGMEKKSKSQAILNTVFLVTTSETILGPNGQLKPYLIERASQFNTEIIPLSNIADIEEFFKDKFNNQKIQ